MNHNEIEAALKAMQLGHAGEAPDVDSFRRGVWREIRHRKALGNSNERKDSEGAWMAMFRPMFPKLAFAGLALAVGVAWATASLTGNQFAKDEVALTTHMLDLSVFSPHREGLADGQLVVKR